MDNEREISERKAHRQNPRNPRSRIEIMNCPQCSAPLIYSYGVRCGICNNLVLEPARSDADSVRCAAHGWAALRWTAEYPRASGVWWWWDQDDRHAPDIVEVRAEFWCELMKTGPIMKWPGLTRTRYAKAVGGLWAGPVNPPATRDEATPPNRGSLRLRHERRC